LGECGSRRDSENGESEERIAIHRVISRGLPADEVAGPRQSEGDRTYSPTGPVNGQAPALVHGS
jgi:hypothetical protein